MTDQKGQPDPNDPPEDVASLYSWANLHGAKYRDFSASRAQTREKARQRVEQAMEQEHLRAQQPAEPKRGNGDTRHEESAPQPASSPRSAAPATPERPHSEHPIREDLATALRGLAVPPTYRQPGQTPQAPMREESYIPPPRSAWSTDPAENTGRPAWLMPERIEHSTSAGLPPAPEDTLQGSRERLATRWFALRSVVEGSVPPAQAAPAPVAARAPVMAIFSLAGGVGKTSLVATLGRALSARGERVLLVDTAAYGLLPFFFGAGDQRPGMLRTFSPPLSSGDAPIQMITLDPENFGAESAPQEALTAEISKHARGVGRVIIDLATASGSTTRRIMRLAPQILVPLIPDMNSVVSVSSIDAFFDHNGSPATVPALPHYVLNQFDASLPLHLDVREVLREQLGDRLLPFVLRRAPAISEALAEGMTVIDYAPNSGVVEDFASLASWVKSLSAAATTTFRGVRWSER
ncbi:MAG TPA: cellulose synthase operon protein YhjQ/BcsQ [Terracidiphilus sp.]|nr:cellulose synthase operon protein YhjQ/BcsQ [Terracidiphilus sp.]